MMLRELFRHKILQEQQQQVQQQKMFFVSNTLSFAFQVMSTLVFVNLIAISASHPVQLAGSRRIANRERRNSKSMGDLATASAVKPRLCNHDSGHTSTSDVSLCYKNGWFLAVYDDGTINGTSNARSPDSKSTRSPLLEL